LQSPIGEGLEEDRKKGKGEKDCEGHNQPRKRKGENNERKREHSFLIKIWRKENKITNIYV